MCNSDDQRDLTRKNKDLSLPNSSMESLTPTKILIVFEPEKMVMDSWDLSSQFLRLFDNVET